MVTWLAVGLNQCHNLRIAVLIAIMSYVLTTFRLWGHMTCNHHCLLQPAYCKVTWLAATIACCNQRIAVFTATASCDLATFRLWGHMTCNCACLMQQQAHCGVNDSHVTWPCNIQGCEVTWLAIAIAFAQCRNQRFARLMTAVSCDYTTSMLCGHITHSQHWLLQLVHHYFHYLWWMHSFYM